MSLRINDTAPDFTAETTQGKINFHDWIGDQWAILFSHPKDFTPVCTTELGYMAGIEAEFTKRNCKLIGLSIDPVDNHVCCAAADRASTKVVGADQRLVNGLHTYLPVVEESPTTPPCNMGKGLFDVRSGPAGPRRAGACQFA